MSVYMQWSYRIILQSLTLALQKVKCPTIHLDWSPDTADYGTSSHNLGWGYMGIICTIPYYFSSRQHTAQPISIHQGCQCQCRPFNPNLKCTFLYNIVTMVINFAVVAGTLCPHWRFCHTWEWTSTGLSLILYNRSIRFCQCHFVNMDVL